MAGVLKLPKIDMHKMILSGRSDFKQWFEVQTVVRNEVEFRSHVMLRASFHGSHPSLLPQLRLPVPSFFLLQAQQRHLPDLPTTSHYIEFTQHGGVTAFNTHRATSRLREYLW
jgi:hypothetical protein